MDFKLILIIIAAFVIAILLFKILSKTFKFLAFVFIFIVVFGVLYFGYNPFKEKVIQKVSDQVTPPSTSVPHAYGCNSDSDCAFVLSKGDCNLVADSCNNIADVSRFYKPGTKVKCSVDSVVLDSNLRCACKKTPTGSYCEKL